MGGVGDTLREARIDRGVELAEVEAATKIRRRFLKAIEDEAWDVLPGQAYAAGFVRAYADHLGLDGARLAATCPLQPAPPDFPPEARRGPRRRAPVVAVCLGLIAAVGALGLLWSPGGEDESSVSPPSVSARSALPAGSHVQAAGGNGMELSLTATAELWVCLLDEDNRPLVDGVVLPVGAEEGPFRSGSFTVSFGNGEVEMQIDGRDSDIPESSSPLGYEVSRGGELSSLSESERPTCT